MVAYRSRISSASSSNRLPRVRRTESSCGVSAEQSSGSGAAVWRSTTTSPPLVTSEGVGNKLDPVPCDRDEREIIAEQPPSNCRMRADAGQEHCHIQSYSQTYRRPAGCIKNLKGVIYTLIVASMQGRSKVIMMITSRQIRAARALLGWSQQQLADKAIVSLNAVARLEKGLVDSRISTMQAIQKALIRAGIEFLDADQKGEGVRLRSPKS